MGEHRDDCPGEMCTMHRWTPRPAQICRERGWGVGTVLEGNEGYGNDRIVITAIGNHQILARNLRDEERHESTWTLACRCWGAVHP